MPKLWTSYKLPFVNKKQSPIDRRNKYNLARERGLTSFQARRIRDFRITKFNLIIKNMEI